MTIKDASKLTDVSLDTLRYYERIGLIPPVKRTASGIRDYQEGDIRWVEFAKCMRGAGLPIEALIEYIELYHKGEETLEVRRDILAEQRDRLLDKQKAMQLTLDKLNFKIERYDKVYLPKKRNDEKLEKIQDEDAGYFEA